MTLQDFNAQPFDAAVAELMKCCGSTVWAKAMARARPFSTREELLARAGEQWSHTTEADWREAMTHHPRIGETQLRAKFASTSAWSKQEQGAVHAASEETLAALAQGNRDYEAKFGFIFLVCATGKSAEEMLQLLRERLHHDPVKELGVAAAEQAKITRIRLEKLLT